MGSDLCIVRLHLSFGLFLSRNGLSFSILSYFSAFVFCLREKALPYSLEHCSYNLSFILLSKRKSLHFPFLTSLSLPFTGISTFNNFYFLDHGTHFYELRDVALYSFDSTRIQFMYPSVFGPQTVKFRNVWYRFVLTSFPPQHHGGTKILSILFSFWKSFLIECTVWFDIINPCISFTKLGFASFS